MADLCEAVCRSPPSGGHPFSTLFFTPPGLQDGQVRRTDAVGFVGIIYWCLDTKDRQFPLSITPGTNNLHVDSPQI